MKKVLPLYVHSLLWLMAVVFMAQRAVAQSCTVQFTYTTSESRCMATGSIAIKATGGSGYYNYKVEGPVTSPFTSSNTITGLPAGTYKVTVKDVDKNCEVIKEGVVVAGSYSDPRFELVKTDVSCRGNDGSIAVNGQQYGRSPFSYTLISPSPSNVGMSNSTGSFSNLIAGTYYVQLQDSCGGIQVRNITIDNYTWKFDTYTVTRSDCQNASAVVNLTDSRGNTNATGTAFNGFQYGVVLKAGDTTWYSNRSFSFVLANYRSANIVVKDPCSTVKSVTWNLPSAEKPTMSSTVGISNQACTTFTAAITGQQNLTSPNYCLYDNNNNLITCNTTGTFSNLTYGSYCIKVKDNCYDTTISRCFTAKHATPAISSTVTISNRSCTTFTATVTGQTNLTNPTYCLYDASHTSLGCNATGVFNNVPYGAYTIEVKDGCVDTTIVRSVSANRLAPVLSTVTMNGYGCTTFNATASGSNLINPQYCLYDKNGNQIACNTTGVFTGLPYGQYCMKATTSCGETSNSVCFTGSRPKPAVAASVQISNAVCTGFTATVTGQTNLTNPQYCLYNSANTQLQCNTTGVFTNIAYGSYCIKITDGCYDTTISRCFSQARAVPSVNATMTLSNTTCSTLTATVTGTNLTNPQYSLYNASNKLIATNTTGVFTNLAYGSYCAQVKDGCVDTTMKVCQTFTVSKNMTVTATKTCSLTATTLQVSFANAYGPYTITVYNPDGSVASTVSTSSSTTQIANLPALAAGEQYQVVSTDHCGNKETITVTPAITAITKSATILFKCPSADFQDGSGDIRVTCSSNLYNVTPSIIKKDGYVFSKAYSFSNNVYTFTDLGTGTYIIQYALQNCTVKLYDTVTVTPYVYPKQDQSTIYQCDNNGFSVGSAVYGGIGPYQYEIIGSMPESPSIIAPKQSSPVFTINNGNAYSLIRLRSTDACGNAALSDASVLPLQNIIITSNTQCLYNEVTLSVDSIPNTQYQWYRKRTDTDSLLVGNSRNYTLPFLEQEQTGTYVCKMSVNNDCLVRLSYFTLTGDCGEEFLSLVTRLTGKNKAAVNELDWENKNQLHVVDYVVERKAVADNSFRPIGKIGATKGVSAAAYQFLDRDLTAGTSIYRIKSVYTNGKVIYSNMVRLNAGDNRLFVYPNPAKGTLHISIQNDTPANYEIALYNAAGQTIYQQSLTNVTTTSVTYNRGTMVKSGLYLLKVTNTTTGISQAYKVLFE